jgi:uncharacterized protein (TIGR01777 family)
MRVGITGASGLVGGHLARALSSRGDEAIAFSRRGKVEGPFAAVRVWDPSQPLGGEDLADLDGLVHLAGEPVAGRWTARKKQRILASRGEGTRNLVLGLRAAEPRPRVLVSASAMGYYGERGDQELSEEEGSGEDFLAKVCVEWEAAAREAEELGVRVARLRIGLVLALEGGALAEMLLPFKCGVGGPLGGGAQWWSWIHVQDLVRMILWCLDTESVQGAINASTPTPVRQRDFARALAGQLGRPSFMPAPGFVLRTVLGEFSTELLSSRRLQPRAALDAGFTFEHCDLDAALGALLAPSSKT